MSKTKAKGEISISLTTQERADLLHALQRQISHYNNLIKESEGDDRDIIYFSTAKHDALALYRKLLNVS